MYFHLTLNHAETGKVRVITLDAVDIVEAHEQMGHLTTPRWQAVSLIAISDEQAAAEEAAEDAAYAAAGHGVI